MTFDINEVLSDMLLAIKLSVSDDWKQVKPRVSEFIDRRKERLELLADLRIKNELSQKRFESRLSDEKLILEAELNAIAVISKVMAQNASNAALDVLSKAVALVIKAV